MNDVSIFKESHSDILYNKNPNIYNFLVERGNDIYLEFLLLSLSYSIQSKKGPSSVADVSMLVKTPKEVKEEYKLEKDVTDEINKVFVEIIAEYGMTTLSYDLYNSRYEELEVNQMEKIQMILYEKLPEFIEEFISYCVKSWSILGYNFGYFGEIINPMFEEVW